MINLKKILSVTIFVGTLLIASVSANAYLELKVNVGYPDQSVLDDFTKAANKWNTLSPKSLKISIIGDPNDYVPIEDNQICTFKYKRFSEMISKPDSPYTYLKDEYAGYIINGDILSNANELERTVDAAIKLNTSLSTKRTELIRNLRVIVFIHEIGHALGFNHSTNSNSIMHPYIFEKFSGANLNIDSFIYPSSDSINETIAKNSGFSYYKIYKTALGTFTTSIGSGKNFLESIYSGLVYLKNSIDGPAMTRRS